MGKYIKQFANHAAYSAAESLLITPNVSLCIQENEVHYNPYVHNYAEDYLTFVALESGTFTFTPQNNNIISYSINGGDTWTEGNSVTVSSGDKVLLKGTMTPGNYQGIGSFSSTANFDVQGNAMSLLFGEDFKGKADLTGKNYAFLQLFKSNTKVINAENLILPTTTLSSFCYGNMFYGCTSLTVAPELPATTLADYCYSNMFQGCTSLVTAPVLPATTLKNSCYSNMFNGCTKLNYIKAMFTTEPSSTYTYYWLRGVSSTGTFVKNSAATWTTTGANGIPTGWTVQTASK